MCPGADESQGCPHSLFERGFRKTLRRFGRATRLRRADPEMVQARDHVSDLLGGRGMSSHCRCNSSLLFSRSLTSRF
jgi:hypothetical protein